MIALAAFYIVDKTLNFFVVILCRRQYYDINNNLAVKSLAILQFCNFESDIYILILSNHIHFVPFYPQILLFCAFSPLTITASIRETTQSVTG